MPTLPPTVAFASLGDPADPGSYSGYPYQLARALERHGVRAWTLPTHLPALAESMVALAVAPSQLDWSLMRRHPRHSVRIAVRQAYGSDPMTRLRSGWARRRLRRAPAGTVGIVSHGTEIDLGDTALPLVTYEDSTLAAATRVIDHYAHLARARPQTLAAADRRARRIYGRARAVCFATDWAALSARHDYGLAADVVHAIGQGSNLDPRPTERDWTTPRYLWAGREWERKGGPAVLAAWPSVRGRHPAAELHLVGDHPDVDLPGVVGHGRLDLGDSADRARLIDLFEAATCFVMPSQHEPAGTVYVEAARAGVGSIGGVGGGARYVIGDGGLLVDPADHDQVVRAMLTFADPSIAHELGARSLRRSAMFTWDRVAGELLTRLEVPGLGRSEDEPPLAVARYRPSEAAQHPLVDPSVGSRVTTAAS